MEQDVGSLSVLPAAWVFALRYHLKPVAFGWAASPVVPARLALPRVPARRHPADRARDTAAPDGSALRRRAARRVPGRVARHGRLLGPVASDDARPTQLRRDGADHPLGATPFLPRRGAHMDADVPLREGKRAKGVLTRPLRRTRLRNKERAQS